MLLAAVNGSPVMIRFVCRYADPVTATGWHMILGGLPLFLCAGVESQRWISTYLGGWRWGIQLYLECDRLRLVFASSGSLTSLSSLTFLTPVFALLFGNLFLWNGQQGG